MNIRKIFPRFPLTFRIPLRDFDLSEFATGTIGDTNWNYKDYLVFGSTGTMVGGKYRLTVSNGFQSIVAYNDLDIYAGTLETTVTRVVASPFYSAAGLVIHIGGIVYAVHHISGAVVNNIVISKTGAPQYIQSSTSLVTFTGKITWDVNTVRIYINGVERFSEANPGESSLIVPVDINPQGNVGLISADFSNTFVKDQPDGGDYIYRIIE